MNKHPRLFAGTKARAAFILLFTAILPVSAQLYQIYRIIPGTMANQWKWSFTQNWNTASELWGDTSIISYTSGGTADQPTEIITKNRGENGTWVPAGKETFEYENGKVKTIFGYNYDTANGNYRSTPSGHISVIWEGDLISEMTMEMNMEEYLGEYLSGLGNITYCSQSISTIQDRKITGGAIKEQIKMDPLLFALAKDSLQAMGFPGDTNWTETRKWETAYGPGWEVYSFYDYISQTDEWFNSSKDSIILDGEKIIKVISYSLDPYSGSLVYSTKDSCLYNLEGAVTEVVTSVWNPDSWEFSSRQIYLYETYPASARHISKTDKCELSRISITMSDKAPVLRFTAEARSDALIQLFDMQGKSAGHTVRKDLNAGTNTVALNSLSQGNYFCRISTGDNSFVVPFNVIR